MNDSISFSYFGRESPAEMPHLVLFITAAEHQVFSKAIPGADFFRKFNDSLLGYPRVRFKRT